MLDVKCPACGHWLELPNEHESLHVTIARLEAMGFVVKWLDTRGRDKDHVIEIQRKPEEVHLL